MNLILVDHFARQRSPHTCTEALPSCFNGDWDWRDLTKLVASGCRMVDLSWLHQPDCRCLLPLVCLLRSFCAYSAIGDLRWWFAFNLVPHSRFYRHWWSYKNWNSRRLQSSIQNNVAFHKKHVLNFVSPKAGYLLLLIACLAFSIFCVKLSKPNSLLILIMCRWCFYYP